MNRPATLASWVLERLRREIPGYRHARSDIRDREGVAGTPARECGPT